eukprot:TRINITY_DN15759_c0_g1_i1.p1 TRINITY_DN15759_c0_g1~~TRINITY_DN15759_c0_g1_i1.p1  ORF type:complete len:303 (-),score=66.20 TRINITY_DN15759_c0_g1_i1:4-912(-)
MHTEKKKTFLGINKEVLQLTSGALSGIFTKTAVAPIERVKILFQIQGMRGVVKYTSIGGTIMTIIKEEGVLQLWKGNGANVVRIIPVYALKFSLNDTFRDLVRRPNQNINEMEIHQMMLSGSLAGLFQNTLTYPLEVIRTRLTLGEGLSSIKYNGIIHCFRHTVQHEGVKSLYKGIVPTWISGAPYVGLQMTFYDIYQRMLPKPENSPFLSIATKLLAGALAGLTAQSLTYPGDTLRRRMQTNGIGGEERKYKHTWDAVVKIYRQEGIGAFYKGISANSVRCIPEAALQFFFYDLFKAFFGC